MSQWASRRRHAAPEASGGKDARSETGGKIIPVVSFTFSLGTKKTKFINFCLVEVEDKILSSVG